jgi:hypothetical protein
MRSQRKMILAVQKLRISRGRSTGTQKMVHTVLDEVALPKLKLEDAAAAGDGAGDGAADLRPGRPRILVSGKPNMISEAFVDM